MNYREKYRHYKYKYLALKDKVVGGGNSNQESQKLARSQEIKRQQQERELIESLQVTKREKLERKMGYITLAARSWYKP